MQEFLDMGGYAAFIWPCFIVSAVLLVGLLVVSQRQLRTTEATLNALEAEMPARKDMS
ncbi:MAG: heme exporter protein CcmD [Rhodospirillales bacterium]|nr:heme exporter protein CcmD [Rhodospirillales bacterium]